MARSNSHHTHAHNDACQLNDASEPPPTQHAKVQIHNTKTPTNETRNNGRATTGGQQRAGNRACNQCQQPG